MNRRNWFLTVSLGLLGFLIGGLVFGVYRQAPDYIPTLKVVGDVAQVLKLKHPKQLGKLCDVSYDGHKYQAIKLMDIIAAAQPISSPEQIHLVSSDGFTSSFPAQGLEKSYITFTSKYGWEAINLNHPINSNAKILKEIVVVSDGSSPGWGLTISNQDEDLVQVTPGQLYTRTLLDYLYAEGKASVEKDGKTYTNSVSTRRRACPLADLVPLTKGDRILVIGSNGEHHFLENRGYLELKDNYINYLQPKEHIQVDKVKGVIIDPPTASIMDTYYDTRHFLENGEKMLVVVLDGFSYSQYSQAIAKGQMPFLKSAGPAVKVAGVYPLASNVWLAAMITGAVPEENGVISEKDQELKVPSLFSISKQLKKQALLLKPGSKLLNTEVEPLTANDQNASGTADDEIYAMTMDRLEQGYDLIVVCFNGIAVNSEHYGYDDKRTREVITETDRYLQEFTTWWPGRVLVVGSAGKRSQQKFTADSIFVPYLQLKQASTGKNYGN
ncbi:MAG: alkaline phosphatase family protein [Syntrophomonas sp.]|nr:alkaline phosphatase family protein [Syntrophomonas sp.]